MMAVNNSKAFPAPQPLVFLFKASKEVGKDKYQEMLQKEHISSVVIPVLSFKFVNQDVLRSSLSHSDAYSAIILTSVRAVDAVISAVNQTDQVMSLIVSSLRCYVVGNATEEAAQQAGFSPEGGHTGNAEALAHYILENLEDSTKPLLFPCSSIHRENMKDILISKGLKLEEVVAYETCPHDNLSASLKCSLSLHGAPDFVAFFSPSGFQFVSEIKDDVPFSLKDTKILALGPATCQSIQDHGLKPYGMAEKPDPKSLLQLIEMANSLS